MVQMKTKKREGMMTWRTLEKLENETHRNDESCAWKTKGEQAEKKPVEASLFVLGVCLIFPAIVC